jgi:hypothetical protein
MKQQEAAAASDERKKSKFQSKILNVEERASVLTVFYT